MQETILVGRYKIITELGRGAFGQTYLAEDKHLPDYPQCVVKQLKPIRTDPQTLQIATRLFNSEAQVLQKLGNHDQIPRLFAYFEENQEFYLVQDLVKGSPLNQEVKPGHQWSETQTIAFLEDILSILEFVHRQNVIHRDIKPSNIIRRASDDKLVLIDFGGVKQINSQMGDTQGASSLTVAVSTYGYTPPEQLQGHPRFSSDIYAVGMTAIQALTGLQPSLLPRDKTTNEVSWRQLVQVRNSLADVLDKMVRSHITERYQSASEVLHDLHKITQISNKPIASTPFPPTVAFNTSKQTSPSNVKSADGLAKLRSVKPWQILVTLAVVGAILAIVEVIQPIFRPIYYVHQGNQLLNAERPEEALASFKEVTYKIKPNDANAWKGQGEALDALNRYEGALSAYEKALQLQPNAPKTLNNKGKVLYELERYPEALDTYEQALKIAPNDAQGWHGKGIALLGLKRYSDALAAFDKAQEIKPNSPKVWQSKALALEYLQRRQEALKVYEEALAVYDEMLKSNPNTPQPWVDRGIVLSKLQRYDAALDSAEKALKINPNFYPALLLKGNTFRLQQRYDEALKAYDKALEVRPNSYLAWHNRGSLLAGGLNNFEEAIKSLDKALEIRPSFYDAWRDRGAALEALNKHKDAINSFDRALKIKADDHKSWASKGISLASLRRYEEALAAFDKAKKIEPNDFFVWFNQGLALEKLQQDEEALKSYDKAIEIKPDFQPAVESRRQLRQKLGR